MQILIATALVAICRIHKILEPKGVNFLQIAKTKSTSTFDNILLTGAFQMAIIDTFTTINLSPVRYIGCSLGEIVCAYANNTIDFEQTTILLLYFAWHLQSSKDNQLNGKVCMVVANLVMPKRKFLVHCFLEAF